MEDRGSLLSFNVPKLIFAPSGGERRTVLVLDRNASMKGEPWMQIQEAIRNLLLRQVQFDVICYNDRSMMVTAESVATLRPTGEPDHLTAYAFDTVRKYLLQNDDQAVDVIFMTNGHNIRTGFMDSITRGALGMVIEMRCFPCVVHCIGLGYPDDDNSMQELTEVGTNRGIYYPYVASASGDTQKEDDGLSEVIEQFMGSVQEVEVSVCGGPFEPLKLKFDPESGQYQGHFWCTVPPVAATKGTLEAVIRVRGTTLLRIPVQMEECDWRYDILRAELGRVAALKEMHTLQQRLDTIRLQQVPQRKQLISERMEVVVPRSNTCDLIVSETFRSVENCQRELERRVAVSSPMLETISPFLQRLLERARQLAVGERDILEQHVCAVSQLNAYELLTETEGDVMGFGVTVQRCMDAPSLDNIVAISTTEISLDAFMKLVPFHKYGRVSVGASGETFNAFLPKYVCEAHLERLLVFLPAICGQFFTRTPDGYDPAQLEGLYSVLGQIAVLANSDLQRQMVEQFARVLLSLHSKFPEMHTHFGASPELLSRLHSLPERFVIDPEAREKSNLTTLNVLYGIVRVMALDGGCTYERMLNQLGLPALLEAEVIRRRVMDRYVEDGCAEAILFADSSRFCSVSGLTEVDCGPDTAWIAWLESDFQGPAPDIQDAPVVPYEPRQYRSVVNLERARENYALYTGGRCPPAVHLSPLGQEAAILLAVFAPSSAAYRSLIEDGCALTDPESAAHREALYQYISRTLEKPREEAWRVSVRKFQAESLAIHLANTVADIRVFAAILHKISPTRTGTLWFALVKACLCESAPTTVPELAPKLHLMVTGLLHGRVVLGHPESTGWHAGPVHAARVRELCAASSPELLSDLERIMRGMLVRHAYRSLNKPNRHGHHIDNPNLELCNTWDTF